MKKLLLFVFAFASIQNAFATKITVYGKNEGSSTTTTSNGDGSSTSTTTISCDNFFDSICYTVERSLAPGQDVLSFGNGVTPVIIGTFVSHNSLTGTVVFRH